jgi:hypothetical protein
LAKEHASADGKAALIKTLSVLPLTVSVVHDVQFLPEAQVLREDADAAKRVDCLINITTTDGMLNLMFVEILNR